jgi:hypothetical protein
MTFIFCTSNQKCLPLPSHFFFSDELRELISDAKPDKNLGRGSKRRAALASGLMGNSASSASKYQDDDNDDEAEFEF